LTHVTFSDPQHAIARGNDGRIARLIPLNMKQRMQGAVDFDRQARIVA